ncbi:MAG: hypothetical protein K2J31_06460 [Alistipes sp.]|nr:hypothetical protein [Alistipes sp.]
MKWRLYIISLVAAVAAMLPGAVAAAQRMDGDDAAIADCVIRRQWDVRRDEGYDGWLRLLPTRASIQYAGGMGMFSVGAGWEYGRRGEWATDLFVGFVPASCIDRTYVTATVKQSYVPWSIRCVDRFSIEPFKCGIYLNSVIADEFWLREPSRYPKGYYGFSTKVRAHIFIGQNFRLHLHRCGALRDISLFWEANTCDLYLISRITNRYLSPGDYIGLSVGIEFHILGEL